MSVRQLLTDKHVERAKAKPGQRPILWDAVVPSLGLRVTDKGHKSFVVQRRVNGKMLKLTLGEYPALGLAEAREKARDTLSEMLRGRDPRQSQSVRISAGSVRRDSFEGAVETYIKREVEKNRRPRTQDEIIRPLRKMLIPRWSTLPLSEIGPRDVIALLDEIVDAGIPVAANRTYSVLHRFFRWCVERHLIAANPAANVRKPAKEQSRSRVLNDEELREVWLATETLEWPFGSLIRFLMLTGQRRNEAAGMNWGEVDFEAHQWMLPATRTKNGREHAVPLSAQALAQLHIAPYFVTNELDQKPHGLVFTTTGKTPVSGFSRAKRKLDSELARQTGNSRSKAIAPWTLHDLRRSCATGMGALGIPPHIIKTVLNHSSGFRARVAGVYQRQAYLEERRGALQQWADHLLSLTAPSGSAENVVRFRGSPK